MNELVVPPAPHWYKSLVVACAPDNTLVYGSQHDIVVIKERNPEESVDVQLIYAAHAKHVVSISLNKNWNNPHCYAVSLGEDKITKVWNLETLEKKTTNKDHVEHKHPVVGAVFAGDNRVVSAAEDGFIIVWNINTNESNPLKNLFKEKVQLTCLSSCPHATWLLAFGLNNGCIVIADLRRDGQVLYRLRGHYQAIVSFSWCPAPVNVFPRYTNNRVKNKAQAFTHTTDEKCVKSDKSQETAEQYRGEDNESTENEAKIKVNPWVNLVHVDDDEIVSERQELEDAKVQDFLEECDKLKIKILGITTSPEKNAEANNNCGETESEKIKKTPTKVKQSEEHECSKETESEEIKKTPIKVKQSEDHESSKETESEEIKKTPLKVEKSEEHEIVQKLDCGRPFPVLFDPSGDFLDDSFSELSPFKADTSEVANIGDEDNRYEEEENNTAEQITDLGNDSGIVKDEIPSTKNEVLLEEPRTEYLLASSGKDKTVHIWRAGTDGRMQTFFHISKKGNRRDKNSNSWISVCWVTPDTILTSAGELLSWPVPKPKETDKQFKVVHRAHSSHIFNVVAPPKYMTQYNWRDKVDLTVWTWSQDGKLVNYNLNTKKIRHSYTTVSALTTCFDACSYLDPNRLAVGLRDGMIHMWDLSLPHKSSITMQRYQQKFTHKVCVIAWHPLKEMLLGFGTDEGRVGFIDLMSKKTTLFPNYFRNTIYKVGWGPIKGDIDNLGLYALAEGRMAIYNLQKPNEDPTLLELPEKMYVYRFAWKPNYSLLLLNGSDGNLLVLKTDLVVVANLYPTEKGMNDIVWHPDAITDKTDIAPRCNWFAAATTKGVLVFDCVSIEESADVANRFVAIFEGHLRTPSSLVWCPFEGDKIVSVASDGLAHVWDVKTKTAISTFDNPYFAQNPVVIWSPVDPDLIIMGDRLIRIWRISQNPPKIDKEFLEARKRLLLKSSKTDSEKSDKNKIKVEIPISKISVIPTIHVANDDKYISKQIANMKHLISSLENENSNESDSKVDPLKIFGNKEQVSQLLDAHYQQQKNVGKLKSCELISLFKGNVGETIQNAINENRVTPSIIALAPMVSSRLWQEACTVYARMLSEDANSDALETAMYFLACHKVDEAINCLRVRSMYKEALALAKHRLLDNSVVITQITEEWAQCCIKNGNFEKAAFCYISIKQYDNAAKVLARRNNKEYVEFALELAEKKGNKGLCDSIKLKCAELENTQLNSSIDIVSLQSDSEQNIPSKGDVLLKSLELELDPGNTQLNRSNESVGLLSDIEQNILSKGDAILKSLELELGNTQLNKSSDIVSLQSESDTEQNIPLKGDSVLKTLDQNQEIISERSSTLENKPHSAVKNEFSDASQVDEPPCNDEISKSENPEKESLDQNQEIISESSTTENEPYNAVKNEFSDALQVDESTCNDDTCKSENTEKE